jgi:hypothetical protein
MNGVTGCARFTTAAVELADAEPTLEKVALHAIGVKELAAEELEASLLVAELTELDASLEFAALELEGLGVGSGESLPPPPQAEISPPNSRINVSL